ncbi:MAG: hypothetical protein ACTSVG_04590 [Alphaproteobacteria bacterium]
MKPRAILWMVLAAITAALLVLAPNALWLSRSSAKLRNIGAETMALRIILVGATERIIEVGALAPGTSRFAWIDPVGEATLAVEVQDSTGWRRHCGEYVEGAMYRVEIEARTPDDVSCTTELPPLNRLLVLDYLP